jgi:ABC-type branched-subunit amino acid transport system ATPase component
VTPLLDVRGLSKRFGGLVANDAVSLQVRAGDVHALIGPNGAGKTTLVSQLAGQLASDAGQVIFDGHDISTLGTHQRARRGLVLRSTLSTQPVHSCSCSQITLGRFCCASASATRGVIMLLSPNTAVISAQNARNSRRAIPRFSK